MRRPQTLAAGTLARRPRGEVVPTFGLLVYTAARLITSRAMRSKEERAQLVHSRASDVARFRVGLGANREDVAGAEALLPPVLLELHHPVGVWCPVPVVRGRSHEAGAWAASVRWAKRAMLERICSAVFTHT
jgi:hypothetical protein